MSNRPTRVLIASDFHSGHAVGLTPPELQWRMIKNAVHNKAVVIQREVWNFWEETIASLQPIDVAILNGDLIDGRGERSGGIELITSDRNIQVEMAIAAISRIKAKKYIFTRGTAYHSGTEEDYEDNVAKAVKGQKGVELVKIGNHEWVDVNGLVFDCKHHIAGSQIPHGRFTGLARDVLWNLLWSLQEEQPKADVVIRSHVHWHAFLGGGDIPLAITTPAMQGMGTRFGARICSGRVHLGLVYFDVNKDGSYTWQSVLGKLGSHKARVTKV
jgi:hypothetical protein